MTEYVTPAAPLRAFVAELVAAGVRDAVVCPGSRSMPMALALRAHPGIRVLTHVDERAAGFLALGLAKASRRPVAVLGTSGTAVVNFGPAVVEAYPRSCATHRADRRPAARAARPGCRADHRPGAPLRSCLQVVRGAAGPRGGRGGRAASAGRRGSCRGDGARGARRAGAAEPAVPRVPACQTARWHQVPATSAAPHTRLLSQQPLADASELDALATMIASAERPLIVVGPLDREGAADAISALAASRGGAHRRRRAVQPPPRPPRSLSGGGQTRCAAAIRVVPRRPRRPTWSSVSAPHRRPRPRWPTWSRPRRPSSSSMTAAGTSRRCWPAR